MCLGMIKFARIKKLYYGAQKLADRYQNKIDEAANNWHRTKDPKYKDLWYKLIKEFSNGE